MARKSANPKAKAKKDAIVAFKVEEELAAFLNKLPNKSDFIRKAIVAQFGMACPLCAGSGVVARGLHDHYAPVLHKNNLHRCDHCGEKHPIPLSLDNIDGDEQKRLEQFFHGGPFYCPTCYTQVPPCDDCGWHIPLERTAEHHRQVHTH
jgi:hypothetical protein